MTISKKLVLFKYILNQFGFDKFEELQSKFSDDELKTDTIEHSLFYSNLSDKIRFPIEDLMIYDENIIKHLNTINEHRNPKINLKYYQYFSLLFTEYYLHNYFNDTHEFLEKLNQFEAKFCEDEKISDLTPYDKDSMNVIAYWQATGSGKTFTLHFNILQYSFYCVKYNVKCNNFILLTPSEFLTKQHLEELEKSGINASLYLNNKTGNHIKVIDIYKIRGFATGQGITISVSEFGQQNVIFVDEGHKGNDREEGVWRGLRERMGFKGFTFEYSATFGQVGQQLQNDYAKNIIFDYSYKHFYKDGYGKDYWIHNISDKKSLDELATKRKYLLLNILLFTQQKLYYNLNNNALQSYKIENPLLVFVGHTVNPKPIKGEKSEAEQKDDEYTISDIKILLDFLKDFLKKREKYERYISDTMNMNGLLAKEYYDKLPFLFSKFKSSRAIYDTIIKLTFNATAPEDLELQTLRNNTGEIALKVKGNNEFFGLINIGDVSTFKSKLGKNYSFEKSNFSDSLFDTLSARKSRPINILIGARKFIEGWNNYRVSSIGLINFGRTEGAQIIQLFGRGVRLYGKDNSLKRSLEKNRFDELMPIVETLNIFGLNADFMKRFKEDLEKEGIRTTLKKVIIPISLFKNSKYPNVNSLNLISASPAKSSTLLTAVPAASATSEATSFVLSQAVSAITSTLSKAMLAFSITVSLNPAVFSEMSDAVPLAASAKSPAFSFE